MAVVNCSILPRSGGVFPTASAIRRESWIETDHQPLNPVLGEVFYGVWPDAGGRGQTNLVVEQVSHHPPITAYYIENKSAGVRLQGHSGQKTSFTGTAINGEHRSIDL